MTNLSSPQNPITQLNLYQSPAIIIAWIIGLLGVLGNGSLIIHRIMQWRHKVAVRRLSNRRSRKPTVKLLVFNLIIVDLMGACYLIIIAAANSIYNVESHKRQSLLSFSVKSNNSHGSIFINLWVINPMCTVARFLYFLTQTMSILLTLLIAIERFLVLIRSLKLSKADIAAVKIALILCWLFCIAKALYPVIRGLVILPLVKHQTRSNLMLCLLADVVISNIRSFNTLNLSIFYGCYFLTISIYVVMLIRFYQILNIVQYHAAKPEIAIAKTMGYITFCNFASMIPITVIIIFRMMNLAITRSPIFNQASSICIIFIFASSISNPLIYLRINSITNKRHQIIHCK